MSSASEAASVSNAMAWSRCAHTNGWCMCRAVQVLSHGGTKLPCVCVSAGASATFQTVNNAVMNYGMEVEYQTTKWYENDHILRLVKATQ